MLASPWLRLRIPPSRPQRRSRGSVPRCTGYEPLWPHRPPSLPCSRPDRAPRATGPVRRHLRPQPRLGRRRRYPHGRRTPLRPRQAPHSAPRPIGHAATHIPRASYPTFRGATLSSLTLTSRVLLSPLTAAPGSAFLVARPTAPGKSSRIGFPHTYAISLGCETNAAGGSGSADTRRTLPHRWARQYRPRVPATRGSSRISTRAGSVTSTAFRAETMPAT